MARKILAITLSGLAVVLLWKQFVSDPTTNPNVLSDHRIAQLDFSQKLASGQHWGPSDQPVITEQFWEPSVSPWLNARKNRAAEMLAEKDADILILPVQGHGRTLDTAGRVLIAQLITDLVARGSDRTPADPHAVQQYFGTHLRSLDEADIQRAADLSQAERVLVTEVAHDGETSWELRAKLVDYRDGSTLAEKAWADRLLSDETPPVVQLEEFVDDLAEFAVDGRVSARPLDAQFGPATFPFPESADDLTLLSTKSPLHAAAYLQVIAAMYPRHAWQEERERLFQRSFVLLQRVSDKAVFKRYFSARALLGLGYRPAAAELLVEPRNEHESALLEYLDGNLPELREFANNPSDSALDFLKKRDLQRLGRRYTDKDDEDLFDAFIAQSANWAPFIGRVAADYQDWANYSSADIKIALENLVPTDTLSLAAQMTKQMVTREIPDDASVAKLVWQHADKAQEEHGSGDGLEPGVHDILNLARSVTIANHVREVLEDLDRRVIPDAALKEIAKLETLFAGYPALALLKGRALRELAEEATGRERETLTTSAADTLLDAYAWTGSLNAEAVEVVRSYGKLLAQSSLTEAREISPYVASRYSIRYGEWPHTSAWFARIPGPEAGDGAFDRCLDYEIASFPCVQFQVEMARRGSPVPDGFVDQLLERHAHRFHGDPRRLRFEVATAAKAGDIDRQVRLLEAEVAADSRDVWIYESLAETYFRDGRYDDAGRVWLAYPRLKENDSGTDVGIANYADTAAAWFYWIGQHEHARPLLHVAASNRSGAASTMSSAQRIALIDGDFTTAAEYAAARVRRYNSKYGARDLVQLLHIAGEHDVAWNIFDQVQDGQQNPEIWSGALVGHKMQSAAADEVTDWLKSSEARSGATSVDGTPVYLAPRYLMLWGMMDRIPRPDFTDSIASLHPRQGSKIYPVSYVGSEPDPARPHPVSVEDGKFRYVSDGDFATRTDDPPYERGEVAPHRLAMLATAMTAFLNDDIQAAFEGFNRTAGLYALEEFLPYFVWTLAQTGRMDHVPHVLDNRETKIDASLTRYDPSTRPKGRYFDVHLARAVLAGFEERHADAMRAIELAMNDRPFLESRTVYPMYQIVDLVDRLYRKTDDERYRRMALELGRRHTAVLPMYAWAYYVVAEYSSSEIERTTAAASAIVLDPDSTRRQRIDQETLDKAQRLIESSGPPYLSRSAGGTNQSI